MMVLLARCNKCTEQYRMLIGFLVTGTRERNPPMSAGDIFCLNHEQLHININTCKITFLTNIINTRYNSMYQNKNGLY